MEERRVRKEHGGDADGASYALGPTLTHALRQTLDRGAQAMLLLNRRGFASYCCCADIACGWVLACDSCDSSMVYHRAGGARSGEKGLPKGYVRCHHCFAQQLLPKTCPRCGKKTIALGTGTQRVEEDLSRMFPELAPSGGMVRVDSDVMHSARDYFRVLGDFREGRTKLLLGTQMIAKGLDFPDVELVGVINADTALSMPDFRASERTYQLVSQVAGRAGRSLSSGATSRVIVQTMNPDERAIRDASAHDFESFATYELETRQRAKLPPHARMARIVSRDEDAMKAEERIARIAAAIRSMGEDASRIEVLGPSPCALSRLHGHYRFSIELFAPDAPTIQRVLTNLRSHGLAVSDTKTAIDVDPVSLM
jgi:primosomal protein N' (replication factor Y)